jgi:hypothetical protein
MTMFYSSNNVDDSVPDDSEHTPKKMEHQDNVSESK